MEDNFTIKVLTMGMVLLSTAIDIKKLIQDHCTIKNGRIVLLQVHTQLNKTSLFLNLTHLYMTLIQLFILVILKIGYCPENTP